MHGARVAPMTLDRTLSTMTVKTDEARSPSCSGGRVDDAVVVAVVLTRRFRTGCCRSVPLLRGSALRCRACNRT